jgi:ribosomal protein S27AE
MSLRRCPRCASLLTQLDRGSAAGGRDVDRLLALVGVVLLERSCPECGRADVVGATSLEAAIAYRRDTRALLGLRALADEIAERTPLPQSP